METSEKLSVYLFLLLLAVALLFAAPKPEKTAAPETTEALVVTDPVRSKVR